MEDAIVLALAIMPTVSDGGLRMSNAAMKQSPPTMTREQMTRELDYRVALGIAENLKQQDVLTASDMRRIEQKLRQKFSPPWGAITR